MKENLPVRKPTRLKEYDYSTAGIYFVTVCTQGHKCLLSRIESVGQPLAAAAVELTAAGELAQRHLLELEKGQTGITLEKYVIMPNHIHALVAISGGFPLTEALRAFKSKCSRDWNKMNGTSGKKLFQKSFYDHIIRNENDYNEIFRYIEENPLKWELDSLYVI